MSVINDVVEAVGFIKVIVSDQFVNVKELTGCFIGLRIYFHDIHGDVRVMRDDVFRIGIPGSAEKQHVPGIRFEIQSTVKLLHVFKDQLIASAFFDV